MHKDTALPNVAKSVITQLTASLGSPSDMYFTGTALTLSFLDESLAPNLNALFQQMDAAIEVDLTLPALNPDRAETVMTGEIDGMRFTARGHKPAQSSRRLDVSLYPLAAGADAVQQRLDSIHQFADVLFASAGTDHRGLVSYIARHLDNKNDPNSTGRLAAALASALADHLAAQVGPAEDVVS